MSTGTTPRIDLAVPIDLADAGQLAAWCRYLDIDADALTTLVESLGDDANVGSLLVLGRRPTGGDDPASAPTAAAP